jgi:hypothetical protein
MQKNVALFYYNSLKMKYVCFIQGLKAYRTVNPLHFSYKKTKLLMMYKA